MLNHRSARLLAVFLICFFAGTASAKTIHVQLWGVPAPGCGSKSTPCSSIYGALNVAGKNDRIIVGPGEYVGSYDIQVEGLRLESAEGPHATILRSLNAALDVIRISQHKVRIGRRGKGLTIVGATSANGVEVTLPSFDGTRVEGNVFVGNSVGIWLQGSRAVARHNLLLDSGAFGIYLNNVPSGMVSDNRLFQSGGDGIRLNESETVNVQSNLVYGTAIAIAVVSGTAGSRIRNNAMLGGSESFPYGIATSHAEDLLIDGNIASRGHVGYQLFNDATQTSTTVLRNNAAVGTAGDGFEFTGIGSSHPPFAVRFDNNTGVSTGGGGIKLENQSSISSAQGNNLYDNDTHAIDNTSASSVLAKKTYFGLVNGVPSFVYSSTSGTIDPASTEAAKPNRFRARRAAKLM